MVCSTESRVVHIGTQVCFGLTHLLLLFVCTNLAIFFSSNLVVDQFFSANIIQSVDRLVALVIMLYSCLRRFFIAL